MSSLCGARRTQTHGINKMHCLALNYGPWSTWQGTATRLLGRRKKSKKCGIDYIYLENILPQPYTEIGLFNYVLDFL
jgi:hypothetical protein